MHSRNPPLLLLKIASQPPLSTMPLALPSFIPSCHIRILDFWGAICFTCPHICLFYHLSQMHCFIPSSLGYFPEYSRCSVKKINSKYKQYCACLPYRKPQSRHKWLNRVQCLDCRDILPLIPPPTLPQGMDHLRGGGQCFPALLDVPLADPELVMMAQATAQRTFHLRLFN